MKTKNQKKLNYPKIIQKLETIPNPQKSLNIHFFFFSQTNETFRFFFINLFAKKTRFYRIWLICLVEKLHLGRSTINGATPSRFPQCCLPGRRQRGQRNSVPGMGCQLLKEPISTWSSSMELFSLFKLVWFFFLFSHICEYLFS